MKLLTIKIRSLLKERYLRDHLTKFFRSNNFNTQYIDLIVKISGDSDSIFYSLSKFTSIDLKNMTEKVNFIDQVVKKFNILTDAYESKTSINNKILIYYKEVDERSYKKYVRNINMSTKLNKFSDEILPVNNIPYNTNYKGWGNYVPSNNKPGSFTINEVYFDNNIKYILVDYINYNLNKITVYYNDNNILHFSDFKTKKDKFKRSFNTGLVVYFDEDQPFFSFDDSVQKPVYKLDKEGNQTKQRLDIIKPINPLSLNDNEEQIDSAPDFNIVTLDIETYLVNNIYNILSVCFGRTFLDQNQFYIADYDSTEDLLKAVFDKLFTEEFNDSIVYIHNGVNFDLIFIVKFLLAIKNIEISPIYKDGKFISLTINYGKYKTSKGKIAFHYKLTIRDSMLLLPSSLSKLGIAFNVEVKKDIFPYKFPNINNLNYVGEVPSYEFFDPSKVTIEDYNNYLNSFKGRKWNLRTETLNYCSKDCISLHQILINFCELVFEKFMVNVLTCPTLPSLSFKVFRTMFLPSHVEIPLIIRSIYENIFQGYYGGHVDLYIPKGPILDNGEVVSVNKIKELNLPNLIDQKGVDFVRNNYKTIKHYDINSLYPSAMAKFKYPTDIIGYFIGDIKLIEKYNQLYKENLGVYKVKVNCPKDIKHPLLPARYKNTTIYPTGTWTGWYFSEDIKNCEKNGYSFEILAGYIFKSDSIFENFIRELNLIKINSPKGSAMYNIAKLFMNSLYGRFGLNPFLTDSFFVDRESFDDYYNKNRTIIKDFIDLGSHYLIIVNSTYNPNDRGTPANVAVALAITAYSRIIMSEFKNRNDINIFYSDTDSLFIDVFLPDEVVNDKELGLYKLEGEYILFIGIGPNIYGAIDIYGYSYTKVKVYKDTVELEILETLLNEKGIQDLKHKKWFKSLTDSDIKIRLTSYYLKPNDNKRKLVYKNNILIATDNIILSNGEKIN